MLLQGGNSYNGQQISEYIPSQKTKEQWLNEGIVHFNANHYNESLLACEQAIELDPHYVRAYYGKGLTFSRLGRYEEALLAYERAIELDPYYIKAYIGKGNTLYNLKQYAEALTAYEQLLQINPVYQIGPQYTASLCEEGDRLRILRQYTEAIATYERAIHHDPNFNYAYYGKGLTLHIVKRHEEALDAYEQAVNGSLDTTSPDKIYKPHLFENYKNTLEDYYDANQLGGKRPTEDAQLKYYHHKKVIGMPEGTEERPSWRTYGIDIHYKRLGEK